jgi:hypothetical protein
VTAVDHLPANKFAPVSCVNCFACAHGARRSLHAPIGVFFNVNQLLTPYETAAAPASCRCSMQFPGRFAAF